jgi:hypothetical protein
VVAAAAPRGPGGAASSAAPTPIAARLVSFTPKAETPGNVAGGRSRGGDTPARGGVTARSRSGESPAADARARTGVRCAPGCAAGVRRSRARGRSPRRSGTRSGTRSAACGTAALPLGAMPA